MEYLPIPKDLLNEKCRQELIRILVFWNYCVDKNSSGTKNQSAPQSWRMATLSLSLRVFGEESPVRIRV
jgi:hypothetical protein